MNTTTRGSLRQLERAQAARDFARHRAFEAFRASTRLRMPAGGTPRVYTWWQRAISAVVAATLFVGPITVTVEQGRAAAGVLAAGSHRLDDDAWQVIQDLAALRVRFAMQMAEAAPIVDPTAPITFQPKITQSTGANGGVPVVNITAPNGAGISLNQYQSFNVDPVGLILNNSLMSGTSLTGGNVAANPNLNGRTASVIVNQVTSTGTAFATLLNGPLEVFGAPATVIIANPNGVATQGAGFTNTIGVTLTTGTPQFLTSVGGTATGFANAQAVGYNVTGGHIQIEGNAGVNGPGSGIEGTVGTIDLIAETIGVNAPLYAGNRINVIAGRQFVAPQAVDSNGTTTYATSSNGATNTAAAINAGNGNANNGYAVDATAYGAMTAGQIQVIGTAAGMGVRTDAQLAANAGDLSLSANGDVQMAGSIAQKLVSVQSSGNVTLTGSHIGIGGYTINANGDVTSTGTLQSGSDVSITAGGNITTSGNVNLDGNLTLSSGQTTTIAAQATAKQAVALSAGQSISVTGSLASGTTLTATAQGAFSAAGSVLIGTDATINGGSIDVAGVLIAQNNGTLAAQGDLTGSGSIAFGQNGTLTTGNDVSLTGKLLANGLNVAAGNSATFAQVQAGGAFSVAAKGASGGTTGAGDVTFNGDAAVVGATTVQAARDVIVNGTLAGGARVGLTAQRNVTVASGGTAQSVGDMSIVATTGNVTSTGTINSGGALGAQAAQNLSLTSSTSATGDMTLKAGNDLTIGGSLAGQGNATLSAGHDAILGGNSGIAKDVTVTTGNDIAMTGALQGNHVLMTAGNSATLDNIQANDTLTVTANGAAGGGNITVNGLVASFTSGTLNATQNVTVNGTLQTASGLGITAGANTSVAGTVQSNGNVTFTNNSGSLASTGNIAAGGNLVANASQSINLGTLSTSALGDMTLTAGQNIQMDGTVVSQGNGKLKAGGNIAGAASAAFGLAANLTSGGDTDLTGSLHAATVQTSAGGNATLNNAQAGSTISLNAQNSLTVTGAVAGGSTVALNAGQDIAISGSIQSTGDTNLTAQNGSAGLNGTSASIASSGALNVQAGTDINLGGTTTVALDTTLNATRDVNVTGSISGQGNGLVTSGRDIGGAGSISFTQAATLLAGRNVAQGGLIQGNTVQVSAASDATVNNVESATTIALTSGKSGAGNLTVTGGAASTGAITAISAGDVTIASTGKLASGSTIGVAAANDINVAGAIESNGDTTLKALQGSLNVTGGINSGGKLTVTTGLDLSLGASTSAVGDVTLNAGRDAVLNGTLVGQANGHVTAGRDIYGPGTKSFTNAAAVLNAQRDIALTGSLQANVVQATGGDNAALNNVTSATTLTLTANGNAGNGDASITGTATAPGVVSLTAARDVLVSGSLTGGSTVTLNGQRNVTVSGGVQSQSDLDVTATTGSASLTGTTTTNGALNVTSGLDTQLGGQIAATNQVTVQAGRDIMLTGALAGQAGGKFTAAQDINGAGAAAFAQAVSVNASHDVALTGSLQGTAVTVTGQNNAGLGSAQATSGDLNVTAKGNAGGGDVTFGGAATASGNLTLTAANNVNVAGAMNAGGTTNITAPGSVTLASANSTGDLTIGAGAGIAASGSVTTNGNLLATAGNDISMGAALASGTVNLQAQGLNGAGDVSVTGTLGSGGATTVLAVRDATVGGNVSSGDKVTITTGRNLSVGGNIGAGADTALTATAGNLAVTGSTTGTGNLTANAGGTLALGGELVNGDTTLNSVGTATLTGAFYGLGAATVNAGSIVGGGALTFGKDINLTANSGGITLGAIQGAGQLIATSSGDMSFVASTAVGNVNATSKNGSVTFNGELQTGGNAQIQAAENAAVTGGISSMGTVNVTGTNGNVTVAGVSSNGDTTMTAGQTLTLSGTSVVAGQFQLTGGNVTLSGSASGSKNVTVTAQNTLDASQATLVSTQNTQVSGANVTLGNLVVGGTLTANASNQLSIASGSAVDVVGATTLASQNGLTNAGQVLAGGPLKVSAVNLTNAANASLASTGTTMINATSFTNAGLVNGQTTTVNVAGGLRNVGGSLMGVDALTINTGALNNQNGVIFAGNPNSSGGPTTGDLSLTINGGNGSLYNAGGQLLAQRNMGISAVNLAFDPSQGTISQGGQLSITAGTISNSGTWNYGGQGVSIDGLYGIYNGGTMTGTAPLTISTGGTFTNAGSVIGNDVTFNGTLYNAGGALTHANDALTLNGNTTNRGTVESGNSLTVSGGNYDNQGASTQTQGNATFNLGGTLQNTGGSISTGNNLTINAGAVVNDQTAPSGSATSTTVVADPALLWSGAVGTEYGQSQKRLNADTWIPFNWQFNVTLGDVLSPTGCSSTSSCGASGGGTQPVAGSGSLTLNEYSVAVGSDQNGDTTYENVWYVGTSADPNAISSMTLALPTVYQSTTTQQPGTSGVISAGGSISLTASSLSNRGGQIAAQGNVSLNIQSLDNGAVAPTLASQSTTYVDQSQYSSFLSQLNALGTLSVAPPANSPWQNPPTLFNFALGAAAPTATGTLSDSTPTGMIAAGYNMTVGGGNLTNAGLMYAGNNVVITSGYLTNQGGNSQNYSSQVGCAAGVPNYDCGGFGHPRGENPNTTTFSYSQNDATIYAGNDLVIAAGQVNNTYGNLLAGHNIVIGGVGTTATSTTPAQSLNNTSGNIVAGNNITLNVSGAITNNLPPPVLVHQNYGAKEEYSGCMTAGGYKESYCEGYVEQQSGSSSVIGAGNNLQINAGSLTNIGSLIAAGTSATINVTGPVVNEAQTLNAYWHSHWVQETGDFSPDKRHDVWACGSVAECTQLYGSAYTNVGGSIDPPTPVGNIAATIQAPNLTVTSDGQIQNVGNIVGTSVTLTGQRLINGITTANTYTPHVNAPSQVISLSPVDLPGLNLSLPLVSGSSIPTAVAGTASYVEQSLGSSSLLGPQQLISALPASLQPSSTLFYYNPQEEDLVLQQAALQQTGQSSFVSGLTYDSTNGLSVTDQEKAILYQNAINYAKQNDFQLGDALSQTQINALTQPMLWYVQQTVPDPSCTATGTATCPTITALMPQVYLPQNWSAMSAGGNIEGTNVTLNFNQGGQGSILNTGSITASNTLTVNTQSLTNEANQVNVGNIWQYVKDTGYQDTTGTEVQPGGFMSAANMNLNVETLQQIGGALQELNADGTVNQAGTQQMLAALQQQLGANFTQTSVSDNLHTSFTAEGGFGVGQLASMVVAVALSAMGMPVLGAMLAATMNELASGQGLNLGSIIEAGVVAYATEGLDSGLGLNDLQLSNVGSDIAAGTASASEIAQGAVEVVGQSAVSAAVNTVAYGGSFGQALESGLASNLAAAGAGAIGELNSEGFFTNTFGDFSKIAYAASHAALGCAASAAEGTGCASGAIGGAVSSAFTSLIPDPTDSNGNPTSWSSGQVAALTAASMVLGGTAAGLLGQNAEAGATAAENETLNNRVLHPQEQPLAQQLAAAANAKGITNSDGAAVTANDIANQLAQMSYSQNGSSESGAAATVEGAVPPNDGTTWAKAGVDANTGQTIWTQIPGAANPTLQAFILQNTNGADVPLLQQYKASSPGDQSSYGPQGISVGSGAGSICPNGNCGLANGSVQLSFPSPATLTDQASTGFGLVAIWLPPPYGEVALAGAAAVKSLNYLYSQPTPFSVVYDTVNAMVGAVIPQGRAVQTIFTLGTTAAQPYVVPKK
ncbi:filamentous hemagglutinin N-terminal domain-containing protein [Trinickia violacea]|uniref:Filamentous hemagglutinin N-terminal domain-containing protein n=1 Tax=Trinickia violacea TaxID=2571746 RepID=A0A4P8IVV3_9BURK|nr:filamentous hemagglutinin N-terminal domain-containing protein [Trinickia violacea]QCP52387.1 filamentous hemagglutinin N-terminal domain-containing protein [Trinickia violacea]